jgi:hypothetical protein
MKSPQTEETDVSEQNPDGKVFDWRTVLLIVAVIAVTIAAGAFMG